MEIVRLSDLAEKISRSDRPWLEFLRVSSLSVGVYHLKAGQADPQRPHTEDEVYYVVNGRASFQAGAERETVESGAVIFVERNVQHRFFASRKT